MATCCCCRIVGRLCLTLCVCRSWTAAHQASLSFTISQRLFKLMSIESVMPSNHLILCRHLLLLPSIFPSIRVFSNELALRIRWPQYWSFSISPSNEYSGLVFLLSRDSQESSHSHFFPSVYPAWKRKTEEGRREQGSGRCPGRPPPLTASLLPHFSPPVFFTLLLLLLSRVSRVRLFTTPWTAAYQAPPSMGFSRQECWSGVPSPSPFTLLDPALCCFYLSLCSCLPPSCFCLHFFVSLPLGLSLASPSTSHCLSDSVSVSSLYLCLSVRFTASVSLSGWFSQSLWL